MFQNLNYSLICLLLFGARVVIKGADVGDALALSAVCALYGYTLYLNHSKEEPINDQVKSELEQLRTIVNSLKLAKSLGKL